MPMTEPAFEKFKAQLRVSPGQKNFSPRLKRTPKDLISRVSKRFGPPRSAGRVFRTFRFTNFAIHSRHASVRVGFGPLCYTASRQRDSQVFKRYSRAQLGMMREALGKLDRKANEHDGTLGHRGQTKRLF